MGWELVRHRAERLMEHYMLTEDEAWELVRHFSDVEIGGQIDDALYLIWNDDQLYKGLKELSDLVADLVVSLVSLTVQLAKLKRRSDGKPAMEKREGSQAKRGSAEVRRYAEGGDTRGY
jgi:hypothetical protein